jgi:uncharacterized protein
MIPEVVMRAIVSGYALRPMGTHGLPHWARVMETGLRLAELTGADPHVVELFAVFHDARRINEGIDHGHGRRGARLLLSLREQLPDLDDARLALLVDACERHTAGETEGDVTIGTCWDADRLDLGRVGTMPSPNRLCTEPARRKDFIAWAHERSVSRVVPAIVTGEWLRPV